MASASISAEYADKDQPHQEQTKRGTKRVGNIAEHAVFVGGQRTK